VTGLTRPIYIGMPVCKKSVECTFFPASNNEHIFRLFPVWKRLEFQYYSTFIKSIGVGTVWAVWTVAHTHY